MITWPNFERLPRPESDVKLCTKLPHVPFVLEYTSTVSGYVVNSMWKNLINLQLWRVEIPLISGDRDCLWHWACSGFSGVHICLYMSLQIKWNLMTICLVVSKQYFLVLYDLGWESWMTRSFRASQLEGLLIIVLRYPHGPCGSYHHDGKILLFQDFIPMSCG